MVDDAYKVKLIEVNSSPAVAEQLLPQMTADLKELQIDAFCAEGAKAGAEGEWPLPALSERNGFVHVPDD
jgi:hypothetical protein